MKSLLFLLPLFSFTTLTAQQFKYDNVTYQTVYTDDLCDKLKENPGFTLLDVRSYGEHFDTSSNMYFNLGYLKNSEHIPINELSKRWRELEALKDKPVFIYCSHSQRSRRASKMLADSGFTKIYNINGGMTRLLLNRIELPECFNTMYETKMPYSIVSPAYMISKAQQNIPWTIVDLRDDSSYNAISSHEKNNTQGRLQAAMHIPFSELESKLSMIPKNKAVLFVDGYGEESPKAADLLVKKGYKDVSCLLDGMSAWDEYLQDNKNDSKLMTIKPFPYSIISATRFDKLMKKQPGTILIDVRNADQFSNQSKNYWENLGRLKGAVNIPFEKFEEGIKEKKYSKNSPIILYTFSSQNEVFEAAKKLKESGYLNVSVLLGGIWNMRWTAYNIKEKLYLKDWVTDIPEQNQ
ncbi:MAG TPA: rhodanese-like domain-containing protein [Chitinophagaceae bacterium]|nr:rhodanese-like domain-containing protein [Chitinophagaceae bacterium]MCB9056324.1 rhodanese-like domain-containing protein [Chitinophagales bacterium]HPG12188.1 rhodanese-like domain-containing protein [Chitinophagaceae bacterium]